jgi:D-lactate dehydrogenase (cytochrome)
MEIESMIQAIGDQYKDYLADESRSSGEAQSISFPETEEQVLLIVRKMAEASIPVTVQGSRTGISGGAVPYGGHILNLSKMNAITGLEINQAGCFCLKVQPGVMLSELNIALKRRRFDTNGWCERYREALHKLKALPPQFFPPDPTETTATIGGMAACNAAGVSSYLYGSTRNYIEGLRVVMSSGQIIDIKRGDYTFDGTGCPLPNGGYVEISPNNRGSLKDSAGFYMKRDLDLVDLFVGSEGMLGIITELTLLLMPEVPEKWGIMCFFASDENAVNFAAEMRELTFPFGGVRMAALEYIDRNTSNLIEGLKSTVTKLKELPAIAQSFLAGIYIELHGDDEDSVEMAVEQLIVKLEQCGGDADATWAIAGDEQIERVRLFRHAAPESVNFMIDKARQKDERITKLGSDMVVPNINLNQLIKRYRSDLEDNKLRSAIFGHIGDSHIHVNIIPENYEQYIKGQELFEKWAENIVSLDGTVTAEHGVGKLKKELYRKMISQTEMNAVKAIKAQLDPKGLFNPKNMFD